MRKLLLSTAASLMAVVGTTQFATAQTAATTSTWLSSGKAAVSPNPPAPGTINVWTGGLFVWLGGVGSSSGQNYRTPSVAAVNGTTNASGAVTANFTPASGGVLIKSQPSGFDLLSRFFFGLDGQSSNGIFYGANTQIRTNSPAANGSTTNSTSRTFNTLYLNNAFAYVSTPALGRLGFGSGAGITTNDKFEVGDLQGNGLFDTGAWNGDQPQFSLSQTIPDYPWIGNGGSAYAATGIHYLSPSFAGFKFGATYQPNNYSPTGFAGSGSNVAGSNVGNEFITSSNQAGDLNRRRNTYQVAAGYTGAFGPVGLNVAGGYHGSGLVGNDAAPGTQRFKGLNVVYGGVEVTFAGLLVGGQIVYGDVNSNNSGYGLLAVGAPKETAYMVGASYTLGPVVAGATFFDTQEAGNYTTSSTSLFRGTQQVDRGIAAGGTYVLTAGLSFFASYLYGDRKQNGFDFLAGASGTSNNYVRTQSATLGIQVAW